MWPTWLMVAIETCLTYIWKFIYGEYFWIWDYMIRSIHIQLVLIFLLTMHHHFHFYSSWLNFLFLWFWQKQIENGGKHLCSVVYGSLPPETRTRQVLLLFAFICLWSEIELILHLCKSSFRWDIFVFL